MTESPEDDIPLIELGLRHKGDDYFVQARRPGDARFAEYGPMTLEASGVFIEALKRTVAALTDGSAQRANLDDLMQATGEQVQPNKRN